MIWVRAKNQVIVQVRPMAKVMARVRICHRPILGLVLPVNNMFFLLKISMRRCK